MKIKHLKLIDGATGRVERTRPLPQSDEPDRDTERDLRQTRFQYGLIALGLVGLMAMLTLFAIEIGTGGLIALSVVALFASLWYGQFWLAILIFLWWLWMS